MPMLTEMPNSGGKNQLRVLIAGSGVAGLEALAALRELAGSQVEITLLTPSRSFSYRPLSSSTPFALHRERTLDVGQITADLNAELAVGRVVNVDVDGGALLTADGDELEFGALVLATGARAGAQLEGVLTWRGDADASAFAELVAAIARQETRRVAFVVPPGTGWAMPAYELAVIAARAACAGGERERSTGVSLLTAEPAPAWALGAEARDAVLSALNAAGVDVVCDARPTPSELVQFDRVVALERQQGPALAGLAHDSAGFLRVSGGAAVSGARRVWAAGDATATSIKHTTIATQQADAAARSIAAIVQGVGQPRTAPCALRGIIVTPTLPRQPAEGETPIHCLWWPPGRVVGTYLARYLRTHDAAVHPDPHWHPHGVAVDVAVLGSDGESPAAGETRGGPDRRTWMPDAEERQLTALRRVEREGARETRQMRDELEALDRRSEGVVEQLANAGYLWHRDARA
jgi:hypothetical protein